MKARDCFAAEKARGERRLPFAMIVDDFIDIAICDELAARIDAMNPEVAPVTTHRGPVMRLDIRNNERVIFDDVALAQSLFERIESLVPYALEGDWPQTTKREPGGIWDPVGLNERFRGYRYRPGHRFAPHFDGAFKRTDDEISAITFLLYVRDNCEGGETRLLDHGVTVTPKRGSVFMFDHFVRHEGAEVLHGEKTVLRSDVMYRRR
jgi:hypothetical protein